MPEDQVPQTQGQGGQPAGNPEAAAEGAHIEGIDQLGSAATADQLVGRKLRRITKEELIAFILGLLRQHGAKDNAELLAQMAQQQMQYAQKCQEAEQLQAQLQQYQAAVQAQLQQAQAEAAAAKAEAERLRAELAAARAEIERLKAELAAAQAQMGAFPEKIAALERELATRTGQLETANERIVVLEAEIARLLSQPEATVVRRAGGDAELQAEIEKLRKHVQILQARVTDLELGLDFFEVTRPLDDAKIEAAVKGAMQTAKESKGRAAAGTPAEAMVKALDAAAIGARASCEAFRGFVGIMNGNNGSIGVVVDAVKAREAVDRALATIDLAGRALS
jgi:predicted nuclease with TOPRIM domain